MHAFQSRLIDGRTWAVCTLCGHGWPPGLPLFVPPCEKANAERQPENGPRAPE